MPKTTIKTQISDTGFNPIFIFISPLYVFCLTRQYIDGSGLND
jgi:hypothetical protein